MNRFIQKRSFIRFIQPKTTAIVQRFGNIVRESKPGLMFYVPIIEKVSIVPNNPQQLFFDVEIKTKDDVSAVLKIGFRYYIPEESSSKALYALGLGQKPSEHYSSIINHTIRSISQSKTLDELYSIHNELQNDNTIRNFMKTYHREVIDIELVNIIPDSNVVKAMNQINASKRLLESAKYNADADYITKIKNARADADSNALKGEGIARQRDAILSGWTDSIKKCMDTLNLTSNQVMEFLLKNQEFDVKEKIGTSQNSKILFFESQPSALTKDIVKGNNTV